MNKKKWYEKLFQALVENGAASRDAKIGAIGADQVRELYKEEKDEQAQQLAKDYLKANVTGIMTGIGGAGTLSSISNIGVIPTLLTEAASTAGGYGGYKLGEVVDKKLGTKVFAPVFSLAGGIGSGIGTYKGIVSGSKYLVNNGIRGYSDFKPALQEQLITTPKVTQEPLLNVGWAPKQTIDIKRAGDLTEMYYPQRWDVVEEGANPFGVWLQGKFGVPRTDVTNPGKGAKAERAREIFASRPQYAGKVVLEKPIQTVGEVPDRATLSYTAERIGADGIIYNNVYDNGYNNNQVIFSFQMPELGKGYTLFERPTKLTWEERLGIPKGERNQPAKLRSPHAVELDITPDGNPTPEFLADFDSYKRALGGEGSQVDITSMFDSPWYKQRLLNQGLSEEQATQLISSLKARTDPSQLMIADGLNYVRNFSHAENGIPMGMTPERTVQLGRHSTHPSFGGKSLIQLTTRANPEDIILHEIGGHRSQPLVADFANLYQGQSLTNLGAKRHLKIGAPTSYGLNWGEVRARALTIAKQMSDAGWNPNSPGQVNVWLNKHILTNSPTNVNQGALYYSRPEFIKAVTTGFKNGGKL